MKKLFLLIALFSVLCSSLVFAEESVPEKDNTGFYLLTSGGLNVYKSFSTYSNVGYPSFKLGGLLGYQFTKYFAMELGYSFNELYSAITKFNSSDLLTYKINAYGHDIKLNFLFQRHLNFKENMSLVPYFGVGLGVSFVNTTVSFLNETTSQSNIFFDSIIKAGLRYNYKYLLVGLGVEFDLRIPTSNDVDENLNTIALNLEVGVKF